MGEDWRVLHDEVYDGYQVDFLNISCRKSLL